MKHGGNKHRYASVIKARPHSYTAYRSYFGQWIDLFSEDLLNVNEVDVAIALSNKCRWGGMCRPYFSVAQHQVVMHDHVMEEVNDPFLALDALTHDADEGFLDDKPTPIKSRYYILPPGNIEPVPYRDFEKTINSMIRRSIVPEIDPDVISDYVKCLDDRIKADEWYRLFPIGVTPEWITKTTPLGVKIHPVLPEEAADQWLDRLRRTRRMINDQREKEANFDHDAWKPTASKKLAPDLVETDWKREKEKFQEEAGVPVTESKPLTED